MKKQKYETPQIWQHIIEKENLMAGSAGTNSVSGRTSGTAGSGYASSKPYRYSVWEDNAEE